MKKHGKNKIKDEDEIMANLDKFYKKPAIENPSRSELFSQLDNEIVELKTRIKSIEEIVAKLKEDESKKVNQNQPSKQVPNEKKKEKHKQPSVEKKKNSNKQLAPSDSQAKLKNIDPIPQKKEQKKSDFDINDTKGK